MDYKLNIAREIAKAIDGGNEGEIRELLEVPPRKEMGDYAFPCFSLAAKMKKSPKEIAEKLASKITMPKGIKEARIMGPYLNFFVEEGAFAQDIIKAVLVEKEKYGWNENRKGKKIMVEYSGPNTNKPLHVGHLRNESTGMSVARILEANGAQVVKANIFSDRGVHICKSMLAYKKWGNGNTPEREGIKSDHFVGKYYVLFAKMVKENPELELEKEALELLAKWEEKDTETRNLWKKMDEWAAKGFMETYRNFGSEFDVIFRESEFYDKAKPIINDGLKKGVFEETEKGVNAKLEKEGLSDKIVMRKDKTSIYITNDLALTVHKFTKYGLDECIWVIGAEQKLYMQQLFKIFELLGYPWAEKCFHMNYEMVYLPEGRLKSREGKVIDADNLIAKAEDAAKEEIMKRYPELDEKEIEKRAREIGLAAIKFFMLKIGANKSLLFDTKKAVSFDGETGPYIQYSYARAKSILKKAGVKEDKLKSAKLELLESSEEKNVVRTIASFKDAVKEAGEKLAPDRIAQYLIELASTFNHFYHACSVIGEKEDVMKARLALVAAAAQAMKNGLALLNIGILEEM